MPDTKPRKGEFGEPWDATSSNIPIGHFTMASGEQLRISPASYGLVALAKDGTVVPALQRAVKCVNALDGCVPGKDGKNLERLLEATQETVNSDHADACGGGYKNQECFCWHKPIEQALRAFAPFMFEEMGP